MVTHSHYHSYTKQPKAARLVPHQKALAPSSLGTINTIHGKEQHTGMRELQSTIFWRFLP
jgi:hypothetical protein